MAVIAAAADDRGTRLTASTAVDAATPSARNRLHEIRLLWVKEVAQASDGGSGTGRDDLTCGGMKQQ